MKVHFTAVFGDVFGDAECMGVRPLCGSSGESLTLYRPHVTCERCMQMYDAVDSKVGDGVEFERVPVEWFRQDSYYCKVDSVETVWALVVYSGKVPIKFIELTSSINGILHDHGIRLES